jgi:hypothetical protein
MHPLVIETTLVSATIRSALELADFVERESNGENGWFRGDTETLMR